MSRIGVCLAVTAGIAGFADRAVPRMQFQELKKKTVNLNMYLIQISVLVAEFAQGFAHVEFGKWKKTFTTPLFNLY